MQQIHKLSLILMLVVFGGAAFAQDSADDHSAVWAAVEEIWLAEERGDDKWTDTMLAGDFMGWPNVSPAPRSKASTRMWARFNSDQTKGLAHELYPLSIVVHGDTAVVHYLYTMAGLPTYWFAMTPAGNFYRGTAVTTANRKRDFSVPF